MCYVCILIAPVTEVSGNKADTAEEVRGMGRNGPLTELEGKEDGMDSRTESYPTHAAAAESVDDPNDRAMCFCLALHRLRRRFRLLSLSSGLDPQPAISVHGKPVLFGDSGMFWHIAVFASIAVVSSSLAHEPSSHLPAASGTLRQIWPRGLSTDASVLELFPASSYSRLQRTLLGDTKTTEPKRVIRVVPSLFRRQRGISPPKY